MSFLKHSMPVEEFEQRYLAAFKQQAEPLDEECFQILDTLFSDVDAYWAECQPGNESNFEISEPALRARAKEALAKLERHLSKGRQERRTSKTP
jgi:hypothetical protein